MNATKKIEYSLGSVTIFLALCLTLIISILVTTLESARRLAITSHLQSVSNFALDSVFSEYCTQLLEEYGIFSIVSNPEEIETSLNDYITGNTQPESVLLPGYGSFFKSKLLNIDFTNISVLTDLNGEIFLNQLLSYMKYKELSYVSDYLLTDSGISFNPSAFMKLADADGFEDIDLAAFDFSGISDYVDTANTTYKDDEYDTGVSYSSSFFMDSLKKLSHIFDDELIYFVVEYPLCVSNKAVDTATLPSSKQVELYNEISKDYMAESYGVYERFLTCEYIINHFSSYTTPVKDSILEYQAEYVLCGHDNDRDNLNEVIKKLVLLRFGFNIIHILTDYDKMNTVISIANSTAAVPLLPFIIEIVIISLWSIAESIIDVRDLLAGRSVPLFKTSNDWSLSLEGIMTFDYYSKSKNSDDNGLSYNNYLEMLLMSANMQKMSFKIMDLIQMDFSTNINKDFLIENCIVGLSADFGYYTNNVFSTVNFHYRYFKRHKFYISETFNYN